MKIKHWNPYLALVGGIFIAGILTTVFSPAKEPKDTFDDPELAYAELQKAFDMISNKMSESLDY